MKNPLKVFEFLFLGLFFILCGCSEDLYDKEKENPNSGLILKILTKEEIFKNQKLISKINDTENINRQIQGKIVDDTIFKFTINTSSTIHIINEGVETYTFEVLRDVSDGKLENLVLRKNTNGEFDAFLIKYNFTIEQKNQKEFNPNQFNAPEYILIDFDYQTLLTDKCLYRASLDCSENWNLLCNSGPPREGTMDGGSIDQEEHCNWVITAGNCMVIWNESCGGGGDNFGDATTSPHGGGASGFDILVTPCSSLKKVNTKVKASLNNLSINASTEQTGEYGSSFQVNNSNIMTQPENLPYSAHAFITIPYGSNIYGAAHTHPLSGYYMFSFSDVITLFNLYTQANTSIKDDVVFMLINPDGSAYAIKIDDIDLFIANIQAKFNATGIYGDNPQPKVDAADLNLSRIYSKTSVPSDSNKLARAFLEHFNGSGMSLYKSTGNFDGWKKLSLPTNPSSPLLIETPCI